MLLNALNPTIANPYESPSDPTPPSRESTQPRRSIRYLVACTLAFSLVSPFVTSFLVIHDLIGIGNITRHFWILDGAFLSFVLNALAMSPLLIQSVRSVANIYLPCVAILVTLIAYFAYEYWMVALMGV